MDKMFETEGNTLVRYRGVGGNVTIPDGIAVIGESAFEECEELTEIVIPEGVTEIGDSAFRGCTALTEAVLPQSLVKLGEEAFSECTSLTSIEIPEKLRELPWGVFSGCRMLSYVGLPSGLSKICSRAFDGCEGLCRIAFSGAKAAWEKVERNINWEYASGEFVIACKNGELGKDGGVVKKEKPKKAPEPEEEESQEEETEVEAAEEETLPGVETDYEFTEEENAEPENEDFVVVAGVLKKYNGGGGCTVPRSVVLIGEKAFENSSVTSVTLPSGVKVIGASAFENCKSLSSVTVSGVRVIRERAFSGCKRLKNMTLPSTVERICENAFSGCSALKSVELPDGVTMIATSAFKDCTSLEKIVVKNNPNYRMDGNRLVSKNGTVVATLASAAAPARGGASSGYVAPPKAKPAAPAKPSAPKPSKPAAPPKAKAQKPKRAAKTYNYAKKNESLLKWKRFLFTLPALLAIVIGCDIFNSRSGHVGDMREKGILGVCIFFFIVYCILALLTLIICQVKLSNYERSSAGFRLKKFSVFITLCLATMVCVNIFVHIGDYPVVYSGGDVAYHDYVKKGDGTYLRSDFEKKMKKEDTFVTIYTLRGWYIDEQFYGAGAYYVPDGKKIAKADYAEQSYGTITASATYATITSITCSEPTKIIDETTYYPLGSRVTVTAKFSYSGSAGISVNGKTTYSSTVTFTMEGNTTVHAESRDESCLAEGTLVTLWDGSQKPVEELAVGDMLLTFNHETGVYESAPVFVNVHALTERDWYDVVSLAFSNGSTLKIVGEHGLFDLDLGRYVYPTKDTCTEYIGHRFAAVSYEGGRAQTVETTLVSAVAERTLTAIYNPVTKRNLNAVASGMLTLSAELVNLFDYDGEMKYDAQRMEEEIARYGLYTYEDFRDYMTEEEFGLFPFEYFKVAVGRGDCTFEEILRLVEIYRDPDSLKS